MNSLPVPNSDIQLFDGTIVMLQRFPGTKWVVHEGWYSYNGRQYSGWYFCSIPAKTIIPVNQQDLSMLSVVADNNLSPGVPPATPIPPEGQMPYPGPMPGPWPRPWPPGPSPGPWPPYPPQPPTPGDEPTVFTTKMKARLDAAFISVPTLKQRDAIPADELPDGKIIRVNSVDGKVVYFEWSKYDEQWKEIHIIEDEIEEALVNYYTSAEVDERCDEITNSIDTINDSIELMGSDIETISDQVSTLTETTEDMQGTIGEIGETLSELEEEIQHISELSREETEGTPTEIKPETDNTFNAVTDVQVDGYTVKPEITKFTLTGFASTEYVDTEIDKALSSISGAMRFIGVSSTPITDGGREIPYIDGTSPTPQVGDVVLYNSCEFVWVGGDYEILAAHWEELGSENSFALKSVKVKGESGLHNVGGDTLEDDITIVHDTLANPIGEIEQVLDSSGQAADLDRISPNGNARMSIVHTMTIDEYGHVTSVSYQDLTTYVVQLAKYLAQKAVEELDLSGAIASAVAQAKAYTDKAIEDVIITGGGSIWDIEPPEEESPGDDSSAENGGEVDGN